MATVTTRPDTNVRTAPPRRTQQERRETTRSALLAAALDQLMQSGLAGFTTTEVCRRAGLSQGALFKHFDTKADLLAAVIEHLFEELRGDYEAAFSALTDDQRSAASGVGLLWEQMLDPRLAAAFELYTAARTDAVLQAALASVVSAHVDRIHELAASVLPHVDAERRVLAVEVALAAMQGLVINQMAVPDAAQLARARATLDTLTVALLGDN
ncbi:MAG: TetR/AcrR family transcriptional regulator [Acidimicrobiales bacterium]